MNTRVYPLLVIWTVSFMWLYIYINNNLLFFEILHILSASIYNPSSVPVLLLQESFFYFWEVDITSKPWKKHIKEQRFSTLHQSPINLDCLKDTWRKDLWFLAWPVFSRASRVILNICVLGAFGGKLFWPVLSMVVPEALMWTKSPHLKILLHSFIQQTCNEQSQCANHFVKIKDSGIIAFWERLKI